MSVRTPAHVPILLYHRVVPKLFDPAIECFRLLQIAISQSDFERQLLYVRSNYTVIGLRDFALALSADKVLPENACVITFDDSYLDHYQYAYPILKKLGLTATFFIESGHTAESGRTRFLDRFYYLLDHAQSKDINLQLPDGNRLDSQRLDAFSKLTLLQNFGLKGWLKQNSPSIQTEALDRLQEALQVTVDEGALGKELYLSTSQMKEMVQGGMELGAHTITHPSLLHIDITTARKEIFESGDFVKQIAKTDGIAFAYPFGEGSNAPSIRRLVHDYGYYAACTSVSGLNNLGTNPLELKRLHMVRDTL